MKFSFTLVLLLIAAVLLAWALHLAHLPAAWLFGPLAVSAVFAVRDWQATVFPKPIYLAAQAVIGTALGTGFSPASLLILPQHFFIFTFAVVFILLASLFNGWILTRLTRLDMATAFLGTMPGGASSMAAMSDSLRADTRLVAVIQYTRLLLILATLALLASFLNPHHPVPVLAVINTTPSPSLFSAGWKVGVLCLIAFVGWLTGMKTRIPAGTFLVPTLLYFLLETCGLHLGRWPLPVLVAAYLIMGLQIGGRFHSSTLAAIKEILIPLCGTTLLLLLGSFALALILAHELGLNLVSAYLAATPGGLDSVLAVAAELQGDTAIILAVHLVRLLCVLIVGPWLVRACVTWFDKPAQIPVRR